MPMPSRPTRPRSRLHALLVAGALACLTTVSFASDAKDPSNVTASVAAEVKNGHLTVTASNEKFGDTAPGVPKKLRVEYRIGSESLAREVPEGGLIDIASPYSP